METMAGLPKPGRIEPAQPARPATRDAATDSARVQALRGLACLLLVGFHVIGSASQTGMAVPDDSWWRAFANVFTPLRMPLFTFLSGFVYVYRPVIRGQEGPFARKKIIRLWLPLLTVTTIYYAATVMMPAASAPQPFSEAWEIYFFSYAHFWFLQAIILIFSGTLILERLGMLSTEGRYGWVLIAAFVFSALTDPNPVAFMSWRSAVYLAPFFLLGLGANRFAGVVREERLLWACAVVFAVTLAIYVHQMATWSGVAQAGSLLAIVIGASGALTLMWCFPNVGVLAKLGVYSYAVYLFHPFFVAAARKAFGMLDLTADSAVFVGCLLAGLIGPVILELAVHRAPVARMALLGLRQ
jgi:glucan biosynthesis protein C